jgi:hypothetical protein
MFLLLLFVGLATSGLTGYVIFGPLAYRHQLDRDPQRQRTPDFVRFTGWLMSGAYRALGDKNLNGLAAPAFVLAWSTVIGLVGSGVVLLARSL